MKKVFVICIFLFLFMGLGGVGDDEVKLPKLKENIKIELIDVEGYKIHLDNVSVSDLIYLSGNVGRGKQIVELNQIKKIDIKPVSDKEVSAELFMRSGEKLILTLQGQQKIKGKSRFGIYSIKLLDVREINFLN